MKKDTKKKRTTSLKNGSCLLIKQVFQLEDFVVCGLLPRKTLFIHHNW